MSETILLKKNPTIEFRFLDKGFELTDEQTAPNSGFYAYRDLQSVDLEKPWYPLLAKCLRIFTWIFNGVPYFPDADSYKKAKIMIHFKNAKLGIWLTDPYMAGKAKRIRKLLLEIPGATSR